MQIDSLLIIFVALGAGAFSKGATGMGLPLIAVPIMAGFLGAQQAVIVITIPNMVSNFWVMWSYRSRFHTVPGLVFATMAGALGVAGGTWFLATADERMLTLVLAVCVGAYLVLLAFRIEIRFSGRLGRVLSPVIAALAGVSQGAAGMSSAVVAAWVRAFQLEKEAYIFAASTMFLGLTTMHFIFCLAAGLFDRQLLGQGILALVPIGVFLPLGMRVTPYISHEWFNRVIVTLIVVMEVKLVWQGLTG